MSPYIQSSIYSSKKKKNFEGEGGWRGLGWWLCGCVSAGGEPKSTYQELGKPNQLRQNQPHLQRRIQTSTVYDQEEQWEVTLLEYLVRRPIQDRKFHYLLEEISWPLGARTRLLSWPTWPSPVGEVPAVYGKKQRTLSGGCGLGTIVQSLRLPWLHSTDCVSCFSTIKEKAFPGRLLDWAEPTTPMSPLRAWLLFTKTPTSPIIPMSPRGLNWFS